MSVARHIRNTLRLLFRKRRLEADLDDELRAYLDLLTEQNIQGGMRPEDARRAALLEVEGVEQVKEQVRDVRMALSRNL